MRRKLFTLFEILVWSVLFFVPLLFAVKFFHPDVHIRKVYNVNFQDINGIIVGSPVNCIGYNVGYVHNITILNNRVNIDIAIVKKDFELPDCCVIKVEETGLGGSRSLEISPCENKYLANGIYTKSPKRIDELLNESCTFVRDLVQGTGNLYIAFQNSLGHNSPEQFDKAQKKLKGMEHDLQKTSSNLVVMKEKANKNLPACNKKMVEIIEAVSKIKINPEEIKTSAQIARQNIEEIDKAVSKHSAAEYKAASQKLYLQTESIGVINKEEFLQTLLKINDILQKIEDTSKGVEEKMQPSCFMEIQQKTENIKNSTKDLIKEDSECTQN